jgi:hypothetical protein
MSDFKINKNLGFFQLPIELTANTDDQLKEQRKDGIVNSLLSSEIQTINDYEITSFSPLTSTMTFDIFFYLFITNEMQEYDNFPKEFSKSYRQYFGEMQSHYDSIEPPPSGFPTFWNSLQYPFYARYKDWFDYPEGKPPVLRKTRFEPKAYEYNSFLKMNFYTTPNTNTQELLFESIIYMNPRWCSRECDENGSWLRPTFNLNNTTDGYYMHWLNNFDADNNDDDIDNFYVTFQFWNAGNVPSGRNINLIPTHKDLDYKKWVQTTDFNYQMMYLRCEVNYLTKTYKFYEFEKATNGWHTLAETNNWKLHQLVFTDSELYATNPNIYVQNEICSQILPIIPPAIDFGITVTSDHFNLNRRLDIVGDDLIPPGGTDFPFHIIRTELLEYVNSFMPNPDYSLRDIEPTTTGVITIKNNSNTVWYLKDIEIEFGYLNLLNKFIERQEPVGCDYRYTRISQSRKQILGDNMVYTLATIPQPNMDYVEGSNFNQDFDTLQPSFQYFYENSIYDDTIASVLEDYNDAGELKNWGDSALLMRYYYPISVDSFWGGKFAELLRVVQLDGNDNTPINTGSTITLNVNWGFDVNGDKPNLGKYSYVYYEPYLYEYAYDHTTWNYGGNQPPPISQRRKVNRTKMLYRIKLYFNDKDNTLPKEKYVIQVDKYFDIESNITFIGKSDNPNSGNGGGEV